MEACKQSKRSIIPKVKEVVDFDEAIDELKDMDLFLVAYENAENYGIRSLINQFEENNIKLEDIVDIGILIGPEGGFEEEEIELLREKGAKIITLGNRILRTETAGFTLAALLQYELGDLGGI